MTDGRKSVRHKIVVEERENIFINGVTDVVSFDEEMIVAESEMGEIVLKGNNLHVNRLNLEKGELEIDGEVESINYEETGSMGKDKRSFFTKIFK